MSIVPKNATRKGPVGPVGQVGPTGYPGPLHRFSDLDHELIKFLDWIKDNYTIVTEQKRGDGNKISIAPTWCKQGEKVYYHENTQFILLEYKKKLADAKH